jgi:hypothetical protein
MSGVLDEFFTKDLPSESRTAEMAEMAAWAATVGALVAWVVLAEAVEGTAELVEQRHTMAGWSV